MLAPKTESELIDLAEKYLREKKYGDAEDMLKRALEINANNPMIHFDFGYLLGQQGKDKEAISAYFRATQLDPNFIAAFYNLAIAYKKVNDSRNALTAFQRVLQLDPDHAESLFEVGMIHRQNRNMRLAGGAFCQFLADAGDRFPDERKFAKEETDKLGGCTPSTQPTTQPAN